MALPWFIPARALGRDGAVAPSERIVLGGIGLGPRGQYDLSVMLPEKDVQFVAICDVQRSRRERVKQMADDHYGNQDCVMYRDLFELLGRPDIDAVLIATGDHWHALASLLAAKAGKDVYCEKPCGLTIGEIQALADGIHRYGRVFQAGTQRRSIQNFQYAAHLAWSGKLGRLAHPARLGLCPAKELRLAARRAGTGAEMNATGTGGWARRRGGLTIAGMWPAGGGATMISKRAATFWTGAPTRWICASGPTRPITPCRSSTEATPVSVIARYANGVKLVCDFLPTAFGNRAPQYRTSTGTCPVRYEGDEGWVETGDDAEVALSENLAKTRKRLFTGTGLSSAGHGRNFFDCVKSRALPVCNQDIMRRSHIACFAAQLSWQLGRKLTLDPVKEEFVGDEEANRMRRRAAREPWSFYI